MAASLSMHAQKKELNKEETMEYIKKLANSLSRNIVDVTLNGEMLEKHWETGVIDKIKLNTNEYIIVSVIGGDSHNKNYYNIKPDGIRDNDFKEIIFTAAEQYDADRMAKALNHLLKLLRTDDSDPFGN